MHKISAFLKEYKHIICCSAVFLCFTVLIYIFLPKEAFVSFIDVIENKTFDIRQRIISQKRTVNKDIVIVSIDDPSYEYLIETYGEWPIPRYIYAEVLDYIQAQKPKYAVFDLLFVKSLKSVPGSDEKLIEAFKKYSNTYTALNFDDYSLEMRKPPVLDDKIKTDIVIESKTLDPYEFSNCRQIMPKLAALTGNIGHINTFKSDDGFIRQIPVFVQYPDYNTEDYSKIQLRNYLYMTIKLAADYLNKYENADIKEFRVDENNNFIMGDRVIPMSIHAEAVLNWYGESGMNDSRTYTYIPMWKVIKSIAAEREGREPLLSADVFRDKIVYIGTSVFALSDIKTVPTSTYMPGVEVHAVLLNNIIDNIIIKKAELPLNVIISLILAAAAAFFAFRIKSVYISAASSAVLLCGYLYFSAFVMLKYNLWIWIAVPVLSALAAYALAFFIKYLITSRDFEHMYKLASTDGLTELYNHRFFQELIRKFIVNADKNKSAFSMIMLDIDFFKKFNDNYGHQAGDAVLKHVAKTLKSCVRRQDYVCRYGGEEMAVLLDGADRETAVRIAQNICSTIASKTYTLTHELEVKITVSLGVSAYPKNGKTPEEMIEYADQCLYKAKENGRNQVGFLE